MWVWAVSLSTTRLISRSLTPIMHLSGILSLIRVGNLSTPRLISALPPANSYEASPKAISGRTSYIRVRLEFLRYPQVIPGFFNRRGCGPPRCLTTASACSWIGHPVSGLLHETLVLFTLGFPSAPDLRPLTSLHTITRRTILQKVPHRTLTCFVCL